MPESEQQLQETEAEEEEACRRGRNDDGQCHRLRRRLRREPPPARLPACRRAGGRIFLARHGERVDHVDASWKLRAPRPFDSPLTERGRRQARELGERLLRLERANVRYIFASPFERTVDTAHQVAQVLDLPVYIENGACEWLNEAWFGAEKPEWLPAAELRRRGYPRLQVPPSSLSSSEAAAAPAAEPGHAIIADPVHPEELAEVAERCTRTVRALAARYLDGDVLVVGHGISVEHMAKGLCGADTKVRWVTYCSLTECIASDDAGDDAEKPPRRWRLGLHCDTSHLSEPENVSTLRYE